MYILKVHVGHYSFKNVTTEECHVAKNVSFKFGGHIVGVQSSDTSTRASAHRFIHERDL